MDQILEQAPGVAVRATQAGSAESGLPTAAGALARSASWVAAGHQAAPHVGRRNSSKESVRFKDKELFGRRRSLDRDAVAPSLDEILQGYSVGPFSRGCFYEYLVARHCSENYEFVVNVDRYLDCSLGEEEHSAWLYIQRSFLLETSNKEINIPYDLKVLLSQQLDPMCVCREEVYRARGMIYELLEDSYREYVRSVRGRRSSSVAPSARRVSEAIPPEALWSGSASGATAGADRTLLPTPPADLGARPVGNASACGSSYLLTSPISVLQAITSSDEDLEKLERQRENSAGTMTSSRASSISSIMDSFKNSDLVSWKKAAKKLKIRRFLNEST